jgi:hypothetical protein
MRVDVRLIELRRRMLLVLSHSGPFVMSVLVCVFFAVGR